MLRAGSRSDTRPPRAFACGRLGTGPLQIVFRFALQVGMLPLTGTTSARHMTEDLQVERFELTPEEVRRIESLAV